MWDWLLRKWEEFTDWLSSLWPQDEPNVGSSSAQHQVNRIPENTSLKGYDIQKFNKLLENLDKPISVAQLKKNAFNDLKSAQTLLKRTDLKAHLKYDELCQIIYNHRANLERKDIETCFYINQISMADLAQASLGNALMILKSRLLSFLNAVDLIKIYHHHRAEPDFIAEVTKPKTEGTPHVPTMKEIIGKAKTKGELDQVMGVINSSRNLTYFLEKENPGAKKPARKRIDFPKNDPYEVLGLGRDATQEEIAKARNRKALKFHPDHFKDTVDGNRMKAINEAFEFLSNPENKKAYDEAHPVAKAGPNF